MIYKEVKMKVRAVVKEAAKVLVKAKIIPKGLKERNKLPLARLRHLLERLMLKGNNHNHPQTKVKERKKKKQVTMTKKRREMTLRVK